MAFLALILLFCLQRLDNVIDDATEYGGSNKAMATIGEVSLVVAAWF